MVQQPIFVRKASLRRYGSKNKFQKSEKPKILQDIMNIVAIASASSVIPGAVFLISYSVMNGFFPYLISNISLAEISLTTAVIIFIFWSGIIVGLTTTMWLYAIISSLRKWYKGIDCPLSYFGFWGRLAFGCFSLLLFLITVLGILSGYHETKNADRAYIAIYFGLTGFFLWGAIGLPKKPGFSVLKQIFLAAMTPLFILALTFSHIFVPLTNFSMEIMDLRSAVSSNVLVTSNAYPELESISKIYTSQQPAACEVQFGQQKMWMLRNGRVVLGGLGPKDIIHLDIPNAPNVAVDSSDVLVLSRVKPSCLSSSATG